MKNYPIFRRIFNYEKKFYLNHFDINMSKIGHVKLGLYNKLTFKQFLDILNPETNCYYLSSPMMDYNNKNMTLKNKRKRIRR